MTEGYRKYQEGIGNVRRVSENLKTKLWVSIGYRKYPEGIENITRVSEMKEGYQKCMKGIEKLKKHNTGFQQPIGNIQRVSKILGGYRKCTKGIGKLKN